MELARSALELAFASNFSCSLCFVAIALVQWGQGKRKEEGRCNPGRLSAQFRYTHTAHLLPVGGWRARLGCTQKNNTGTTGGFAVPSVCR